MNITIENLRKTLGNKLLFDQFNETFFPGEIIGFVGKNGSGKTTLIKLLCGILDPESGSVFFNQWNIRKERNLIMKNVGVLFDGTRHLHWRLTSWQNFLYFAGLKGCFGNINENYGLSLFSFFDIEEYLNEKVEKLSLGTKRKVSLCCALSNNPSVLFLDEPTNGLDVNSKERLGTFLQTYSSQKKLALVASHDKEWLSNICSRMISLGNR